MSQCPPTPAYAGERGPADERAQRGGDMSTLGFDPGPGLLDPGLTEELRVGLDAVEVLLRDSLKSEYPFVTETSRHLVDAGGKRVRPLLVVLAAQFGPNP